MIKFLKEKGRFVSMVIFGQNQDWFPCLLQETSKLNRIVDLKFKRYNFIFLFIGVIGFSTNASAQQAVSPSEILDLISESTIDTQSYHELVSFLNESSERLNFLDKIEVRSETDEFDFGRQEYLLRTSFNSIKENRIHGSIYKLQSNVHLTDLERIKQKSVYAKYQLIVDWFFLQEENTLLNEKIPILEDKLSVAQFALINGKNEDVKSIVDVSQNKLELDRAILNNEHKIRIIQKALFPNNGIAEKRTIDAKKWIKEDEIHTAIQRNLLVPAENTEFLLRKEKLSIAELNLQMEKAAGKRFFDFAQVKYAGRDKIGFGREFSLGLGFILPTGHVNRSKVIDAQYDVYKEQLELQQTKYESNQILDDLKMDYEKELAELNLLKTDKSLNNLRSILAELEKNGISNPAMAIEILDLENKHALDKLEIIKKLNHIYLEILYQLDGVESKLHKDIFTTISAR